jgi:hypothetical protein
MAAIKYELDCVLSTVKPTAGTRSLIKLYILMLLGAADASIGVGNKIVVAKITIVRIKLTHFLVFSFVILPLLFLCHIVH